MNAYAIPGIPRATDRPTRICEMTAEYFGFNVSDLKLKWRRRDVIIAREVCYYLLRTIAEMTLQEIGDLLYRHHSTVFHGLQVIEDELKVNKERVESIQIITNRIKGTW